MLVVVIPRCIVPQADRCLRCFVPACGSATALCTLSGTVCGVPSKLSDRLRNVGSTSRDKDALVGAWNNTYFGKWIFKILSRYWRLYVQVVSGRYWLCDFSIAPTADCTCCSVPLGVGFAVPVPSTYWSPIPLFSRLSPRPASRLEAVTASASVS